MKACKKCKFIVLEEKKCPVCNSEELTEHFAGMVLIINNEKSQIANISGIKTPGKYALRIKKHIG